MKKNTNKAFTLVELIVVITILAVLGTIAFISLQGYSADARNSKRTSNLNNIQSAISIKMAEGGWLMAFSADNVYALSDGANLGWAASVTDTAVYQAGKLNYAALWVKPEEFQDPGGQDYPFGATTSGARFELAASLEVDGTRQALVKGTYTPRDDSTAAITSVSGNVVTLASADTNRFRAGDSVTLSDASTDIIKKVARDWINVTLTTTPAVSVNTMNLTNAEEPSLTADRTDKTLNVTTGQSTTLPY